MTTLERRYHKIDDIEVRSEGDTLRFAGHVAKFDRWSEDLGFREKIAPGAFLKTAKEADIRFLFNHDPNFVLGRTRSGTATVREDETGLFVEGEAPNTTWARDLHESVKRGDINQGSFGFRTIKDSWNERRTERTLEEVALFDVSIVTFPAYQDTDLSARAAFHAHGLSALLSSGNQIPEKELEELRRLLEPAEPVGDHSTDEPSAEEYLTDLALRIRRLRAA